MARDITKEMGAGGSCGAATRNSYQCFAYATTERTLDATRVGAYIGSLVKGEPAASSQTRLVSGSVCPRFIPTCSVPLLRGLGEIAEKHRCWVQSHIAESPDEMAFVDALHPGRRDAEIFDAHKLLTSRTVMAHGVHLRPEEVKLLVTRGSGVACCPHSNFFFAGGELPLKQVQAAGLRVADMNRDGRADIVALTDARGVLYATALAFAQADGGAPLYRHPRMFSELFGVPSSFFLCVLSI